MRARDEFMGLADEDRAFATSIAVLRGLDDLRGGAAKLPSMHPDVKFTPECDYSAASSVPGTAHRESKFLLPTLDCPHPMAQIDRHLFPRVKDLRLGFERHLADGQGGLALFPPP